MTDEEKLNWILDQFNKRDGQVPVSYPLSIDFDEKFLFRFKNGMTLSQAVSHYARLLSDQQIGHEDVDAHYAPSECHDLLYKTDVIEIESFFWMLGITEDQFFSLIAERTTEKWAHSGLSKSTYRIHRKSCTFLHPGEKVYE